MSLELHTRPLSGTAAQGMRTYPSQRGSVAVVVYPEEYSGSNAVDRYRQGVNVRSIDNLYSHIGMKPQPINDLHKVRDGRVIFEETPFDDNEAPLNMGISSKSVYSGTIIYSSSLKVDASTFNGLLAPSIGSGTIRFFRANDAAISAENINGTYVEIQDAAVPHHQKARFIFSNAATDITKAAGGGDRGSDITVGLSGMSTVNSGTLAARLVEAINDYSDLAVRAFSGSIPASNIYADGKSDTVTITQNDIGALLSTGSANMEGAIPGTVVGSRKGSGGTPIVASNLTYVSASGFDGARKLLFTHNPGGLIGTRSLYTGGERTGETTHFVFTGMSNPSSFQAPHEQYRYLQSTQKYGRRGTNVNIKFKVLKGPFRSPSSSPYGDTIQGLVTGQSSLTVIAGEKPDSGEGLYVEMNSTLSSGSWTEVAYYDPASFTSGLETPVTASLNCWTGPKYFRIVQKKFSGATFDKWAVSDLFVVENVRKKDSVQPLSERSRVVLDPTNSQSGVRSAPNHFHDDRDLGMTDVYQDGELFKDTATVNPVEIVIQDPLTIDIPKMMVDASDQGLMDGVLEPFPIRSIADRSNIQLPYTARGIKADMTLTDVYRKSDTISQEYRRRSVRTVKLPDAHKRYSGDSEHLIIPISSSLGRGSNYLQGSHLPTTGSAIQFFVPSYQVPRGKEFLTKDEILSGSTVVARSGRHMTILLHNHPSAVITGVNPHPGTPGGSYNYRQIAIGPGHLSGYTNAQWNAGLTDAQIVSVAAKLRDNVIDAINGTPNPNVHRGEDTTTNFGVRAEALGGIVTGTLGGGPAKFFRIRLTATVPGKRGDDITINQVSGTDATPGNELVSGVTAHNFAGGHGIIRQRRRHIIKGNDSYFDGVETFGLDILDDADRVKQRVLQVVIDSDTGDTAPVEAYEDWVAMNISGTYGKSHLAPIQLQGFVAPSNATLGAFDDASDTILRVRGIKDAADLFAASDESYTTLLNSSFKSINTTLYSAATSSAPLYQNTAGADGSAGTVGKGHPTLSPAYFSATDTAMSNLIAHYSFMGSTTPTKRSNTSVAATTKGSFVQDGTSPFISSQGVGSVKVAASSGMSFPTVLQIGPKREFSGNRDALPEHYLRVKGSAADNDNIDNDYVRITPPGGSEVSFQFNTDNTTIGTTGIRQVGIQGLTTNAQIAGRLADAINTNNIGVVALSGSHTAGTNDTAFGSTTTDTIKLVVPVEGDTSAQIRVSDATYLTSSHPNLNHNTSAGGFANPIAANQFRKFATGSIGHRDSAFSISFWMKGDGDRNFYLAQSYCATDDGGASNYGSRNWNIRFSGYDYETYSYQYMYFYLFDNDTYPTNYSFLYRRFYGHNSGNGFGNSKLVNAMTDGNWHHFLISYDGDVTSTLTHNENIPKSKSIGKMQVKTADLTQLNDKYFIISDVVGNRIYYKFKNTNAHVDGRYCDGSTLYINVGIQHCDKIGGVGSGDAASTATTVRQIAQRIASAINATSTYTQSPTNRKLHVHAYTYDNTASGMRAPNTYSAFSNSTKNRVDFGANPATALSFDGTAGNEGDTITTTEYATSAQALPDDGTVLLVQQYAGPPRYTYISDNISYSYLATTSFTGHTGVYYDQTSNYYIGVDPITVDGKPHEHFKLYIDGEDTTDSYSMSNSNALSHYSGGTSGSGSRYVAMGKKEVANIEIGGLSQYTSWSSSRPSIFLENPIAEIAFYKGLLDQNSIKAIYEMSLIQDPDMLSSQPLVAALMKSNVSAQDLLSRDHVSATAGYEYNNNVEVGTDSLAFGGLKK